MSVNDRTQVYYLKPQVVAPDGTTKDRKGVSPVACIALSTDTVGNVARGISICSNSDNWERQEGRKRAVARAAKALGKHQTSQPIGMPVVSVKQEIVRDAGLVFLDLWRERFGMVNMPTFKSSFNPPLTDFERKIISNAEERREKQAARDTVPAAV